MPRKAKSFKTQKNEAAALWRKGKRTEANELWNKVANDKRARRDAKHSKKAGAK